MTTHSAYPPTVGVVLAGGAGKRLGGDKTLRMLGGSTLLTHAIRRLRPQCANLLISANGDAMRFGDLDCEIVPDSIAGLPGPLGGILAALDRLAQRGHAEWLVSAPVDCPFLPHDLAARLHAARGDAKIAVASSGERTHPVIGLWHVSLRADLYHALASEDLHKAAAFVARHPHSVVEWPTNTCDPFFNVNTPDDLAQAERLIAAEAAPKV